MRATRYFIWLALLLALASRCFAISTLPRPNVHVVDGGIGSILYRCTLNAPTLYEFFAYDALGSTVSLTLNDGSVESSDLYEAFGGIVSTWGTSVNNRLSHTKERDLSLGLDNHGFRYYDPVIGRYITRDPLGYGDGLNVYLYVHDNPINHIDPLGLSEENGYVNDVEEAMATQPVQSQPSHPVMRSPQTDEEYIQQVMENRNRMGSPNAYTKVVARGAEFVLDTINSFDPVTPGRQLFTGKHADGTPLTYEEARTAGQQYVGALGALSGIVMGFVPEGEGFSFSRTVAKTKGVSAAETEASFGRAASTDYRATFFAANPELEGQVVVHHAVEQQTLTRFPGVVSETEIHSLENLRGIPKTINSDVHLSQIRREWNQFYRQNPAPTQQQLLQKATEIDAKFGSQFQPRR